MTHHSVTVTGAASSLSASQSGTAIQSKAFRRVLLEQHGAPECFRTTAATVAGSIQSLVMAVDVDGNEIGQRCDQSLDSAFDPCQGQSEPPPVSLQKRQGHIF